MVGDGVVLRREDDRSIKKNRKELFTRILSSFIFLPAIGLMYFASYEVFCLLCFVPCAVMAFEIFSNKIKKHFALRFSAFAICILGVVSFIYCRKVFGISGCVFLIIIASFTDIGAYCFGKMIGGPKLCPKISPNKTWAGFWGGVFLSNLAFYCFNNLFFFTIFPRTLLPEVINSFIIVQYVVFASIAGDLLESFFKRRIGVKDMGKLFPGHGGMLDRLDSLIFASIAFALVSISL